MTASDPASGQANHLRDVTTWFSRGGGKPEMLRRSLPIRRQPRRKWVYTSKSVADRVRLLSVGLVTVDSLSFEALTPTAYLDRAAAAHGDRIGVVDGDRRWTYAELHERCTRLAGALAPMADGPVAVMAPNTHVMLEANFGVPWAGQALVAINTRLSV